MSLRVDLEETLEALRNTRRQLENNILAFEATLRNSCAQLESDILALEQTVADHFDLKSKPVPAKVLQGLEKAINGQ